MKMHETSDRTRGPQGALPSTKGLSQFIADCECFFYGRPITYIDVGAYHGDVFRRLCESEVNVRDAHLIEPNPRSFLSLQKNVSGMDNATCHNIALSSTAGDLKGHANRTMTQIVPSDDPAADVSCFVTRSTTLDDLSKSWRIPHIHLLKVDVEGHEAQVLEGARTLLSNSSIDIVYLEAGLDPLSRQHCYYRVLEDVMREHGYRLFRVYEQTHDWSQDSPVLRRANLAFISKPFADKNPYKLTKDLFHTRKMYRELAARNARLEETITQLSTEKPANDRPKRRFGTKALRRKVSPKSILTRLHVTEDEVFWHMRSALTRTKLLRFVRGAEWVLSHPAFVWAERFYLARGPAAAAWYLQGLLSAGKYSRIYQIKTALQSELANKNAFLIHGYIDLLLSRWASAFAFGADAADGILQRFKTDALRELLGKRAYARFISDASICFTRVGRYADARALLDREIALGTTRFLSVRAEVAWVHDPERAVEDLTAYAERVGEKRKEELLRKHICLNVLKRAPEQITCKFDDGEFALVDAIRAHSEGRWQDYRQLVNRYFSDQGLTVPLNIEDAPFSYEALLAEAPQSARRPADASTPLVSVIMSAYNAESTIRYAVRSILSQTHENLELIIIEDCGQDDTRRVLSELQAQDPRIKVLLNEKNVGTYTSRNVALTHVRGDYVTFHDSDDWAHPQRIEKHLEAMASNGELVATQSSWIRVDATGKIDFRRWLKRVAHPNPASLFVRRAVFDKIGVFDTVRFGADTEFWSRIQRVYSRAAVRIVPLCLGVGLLHDSSLTQSGAGAVDREHYSPARAAYRYSWLEWHSRSKDAEVSIAPSSSTRKFWAPQTMLLRDATSAGTTSLSMCYPGLDGEVCPPKFVFGISLASKRASKDWETTTTLLRRTLRSVLNQDDPRWRVIVCGHERPDLEELDDPRVLFLRADIDPPVSSAQFRRDKMWKRRLIGSVLKSWGGGYFFPLDADDLVHKSVVKHVLSHDNRRGYSIHEGYAEDYLGGRMAPVPGVWSQTFDRVCGSSAVLYFEPDDLPSDGKNSDRLYFNLFQSHAYWPVVAEECERPLDRFPFAAAVYVVNHSQNLSFGLQRAGQRTANIVRSIEKHALEDGPEVLRELFGQHGNFPR